MVGFCKLPLPVCRVNFFYQTCHIQVYASKVSKKKERRLSLTVQMKSWLLGWVDKEDEP